jgi:hypothetical protein
VQKRLLFKDDGAGTGGSALIAAEGSTVTLKGVFGSATVVDLDTATATHPYFLEISGAASLENVAMRHMDAEGLWLSGSGGVSMSSVTFDTIGGSGGAYVTAQDLSSSAVLDSVTFDPGTADPNNPFSVRVLGNDAGLGWAFTNHSGNRTGDASDSDPNNRVYWAGSTPVGTPGVFSAAQLGDGFNLSWTAPASPPAVYRGAYVLSRSSVSAAGPFAQIAAPAAGAAGYDDPGLQPQTTYYYRLWASDLAGALSASFAAVSRQTGDFSQPALLSLQTFELRSAGVGWSSPLTLTFNKPMQAAAVQAGVSLTRLSDNMAVPMSSAAAVAVTPDVTGSVFTVSPAAPLGGNSLYELAVSTTAQDLLGQPLPSSATLRFTTLLDHAVDNVAADPATGASVDIPAMGLAGDGYIVASAAAAGASEATQKLVGNTGDPLRTPVGSGADLEVFNSSGAPQSLSSPVTVTLPYADADGDGLVDGTSPPVKAKTLSIYWLDEARNVWHRLPSSRVDAAARTVSAETAHFTTFANIGQGQTDLSAAHAFPNPYVAGPGAPAGVTFSGLGDVTTVRLYTSTGRLVRELAAPVGAGQVDWNLLNQDGEAVAPGLYLYRITSGDAVVTGKIGVVK